MELVRCIGKIRFNFAISIANNNQLSGIPYLPNLNHFPDFAVGEVWFTVA